MSAKANSAFVRLYNRVKHGNLRRPQSQCWQSRCYHNLAVRLWMLGFLPTSTKRQERFLQRCRGIILSIHLSDYVTIVEILKQAVVICNEALLLQCQLHWESHVSRKEDNCLPKIVLYGEVSTSKRNKGSKEALRGLPQKTLTTCNIAHQDKWKAVADRASWCISIRQAVYPKLRTLADSQALTNAFIRKTKTKSQPPTD